MAGAGHDACVAGIANKYLNAFALQKGRGFRVTNHGNDRALLRQREFKRSGTHACTAGTEK